MHRPIFLLSSERSGSTLLRYMLDTHPEIGCPGELCLGMLAANLIMVERRLAGNDQCPPLNPAAERELPCKVRALIDGVMCDYLRRVGKAVWCDKAPRNTRYLSALDHVYPDAKFIALYRNCLDTVSSCLEQSAWGYMEEQREYVVRNPGNLVQAMAENWADKTECLLAFEKAKTEGAIRVRYEDLVSAPETTTQRITSFLGLEWSDRMTTEPFLTPHFAGGGDVKIKSQTAIHRRSVGKGRRSLPVGRINETTVTRINKCHSELRFELI